LVLSVYPDRNTEIWLLDEWTGEFEWDQWNTTKLSKHGLSREEVESIFFSPILFGGKIREPEKEDWLEDRFVIFGETESKKTVTMIWTKRKDKIRVISCRRMRENEKRGFYEKQ
jgi:uncharacterized DUF497 family protein